MVRDSQEHYIIAGPRLNAKNWVIVMGAYLHWVIRIKRYPGRAHGKQGRLKKDKPVPLLDLNKAERWFRKAADEGHGGGPAFE